MLNNNVAIIAVHLVGDIVSEGTAFGSLFYPDVARRDVIAACNTAFAAVAAAGGLVVPVRITFKDDYSDADLNIPLLAMAQQAGALIDGHAGADLVESVVIPERSRIITHKRPGPFASSNLQEVLDSEGITDVIVCGVATNASVESTVRQASDLGYRTFVLDDACSAADEAAHVAAITSMSLFSQVITLADLT